MGHTFCDATVAIIDLLYLALTLSTTKERTGRHWNGGGLGDRNIKEDGVGEKEETI